MAFSVFKAYPWLMSYISVTLPELCYSQWRAHQGEREFLVYGDLK